MAIVDPFDTPAASGGIVDPFAAGPTQPAREPTPAWGNVPLEAAKHFLPNVGDVAMGVGRSALNAVENYAPYGPLAVPKAMFDVGRSLYNDPAKIPRAVWNDLAEKYGGEENLRRSLAFRPAEVMLDALTVAAPIEGVAGKIGEIGRAADVSKPFYEGLPREPPPPPPPAALTPPPTPPPIPGSVEAAVGSMPYAMTAPNTMLGRVHQQAGQVISKIPFIGDKIAQAVEAVPGKFGAARDVVADQLGNYRTKGNVAADIGAEIGGQAEAETKTAQDLAQRTDVANQAAFDQANQAREAAIAEQEARSTQATQQQFGDVAPVDMGDPVIDTVRRSHNAAEDAKNAAYRDAANIDATVLDRTNRNAHGSIQSDLLADTPGRGRVNVNALEATSAGRAMMDRIQEFSQEARTRMTREAQAAAEAGGTPAETGQSMRDVENLRQDLNLTAGRAANDADRRATRAIGGAFDRWHKNAVENHLMEGSDPSALPAFQNARALNRDFRQRFGYNDRNDADTVINKIVQPGNQIGPEEVSKSILAGGDKSGRLLDAIYQATGDHPNHPNVVQAIRGGIWRDISGIGPGEGVPTAERVATKINRFMNRREVADRVYTRDEQALALGHAQTLRDAVEARTQAAADAKANRPVPTEVTKGPMQELADRVLGKGQKPDEALYDTLEGYAKSRGGGKDIETLNRVMSSIPEALRGNFVNTFIRRLGGGEKFSPATFANEWMNKVSPQAKQVLLRNGGHVGSLDELARASKQFDDVYKRFGNPSGSGGHINFGKVATIAAAAVAGKLVGISTLGAGWFAGRRYANFLARPAGAASASRLATALQRVQSAPSLANAAAVKMSVRNMRNTATALGIANNIPDQDGSSQ
jgi:hypothetical protein